jgi:hypothetical protein
VYGLQLDRIIVARRRRLPSSISELLSKRFLVALKYLARRRRVCVRDLGSEFNLCEHVRELVNALQIHYPFRDHASEVNLHRVRDPGLWDVSSRLLLLVLEHGRTGKPQVLLALRECIVLDIVVHDLELLLPVSPFPESHQDQFSEREPWDGQVDRELVNVLVALDLLELGPIKPSDRDMLQDGRSARSCNFPRGQLGNRPVNNLYKS